MDTRKPLWPKIVATVVVLALAYVASWGPALWLLVKLGGPEWMFVSIETAYYPVEQLTGQHPVGEILARYSGWWINLAMRDENAVMRD